MDSCQQTLSQFTASGPKPTITSRSNPRSYDRIGQDHHGRESDGPLTELEPALVACRASELVLDEVAADRGTEDAFYAGPAGDDERRD